MQVSELKYIKFKNLELEHTLDHGFPFVGRKGYLFLYILVVYIHSLLCQSLLEDHPKGRNIMV